MDGPMSQSLPTGKFKWIKTENIDLDSYNKDSDRRLLLEVDLECSKELHDIPNDYPVAPEKKTVNKEELSKYCKRISQVYGISSGKVSKLVTTLYHKEKYIVHYRNLQLYLSLGMKFKKIHRALEFNQSKWLKQYIDFNTQQRTNAKNAFEKDFF